MKSNKIFISFTISIITFVYTLTWIFIIFLLNDITDFYNISLIEIKHFNNKANGVWSEIVNIYEKINRNEILRNKRQYITEPFITIHGESINIIQQKNCLPGEIGPPGKDGIDGIPGENGINGIPGINGNTFNMDIKSLSCQECPIGSPGLPGQDGPPGQKGLDGAPGLPGSQGKPGLPGIKGKQGDLGPIGLPGKNGEPGIPGKNGTKYIILSGPPGKPGLPGKIGRSGKPGLKGKDNVLGSFGPIGPRGLQGKKGLDGIPGAQGPPGPLGIDGVYCPCPPRVLINFKSTSLPVDGNKLPSTRKPPLLILPEIKPLPRLENGYLINILDNNIPSKTEKKLYFTRNLITRFPIKIKHIKH